MLVAARDSDFKLPEYAAYNYQHSQPPTHHWSLPFALYNSQLSDSVSILNCSLTNENFHEKLVQLFPRAKYQYRGLIRDDRFAISSDLPDHLFDRVLCIDTLEHLRTQERAVLVEVLSRRLKTGGLLVLTSRYWFDPQLDQLTPTNWIELCRQHDLHPLEESTLEPRADEHTLRDGEQIHPHAHFGTVFYKSERPPSLPKARLVLSLLTWNTREVSVESLRAHIRESHMLQRLGHSPFIVVCDNGSTDGTMEAMRALEVEIDVPYAFIFNGENRGISVARNQIIDYARQCGADYLVSLDGDIEIIPFSSFAMMRYLENNEPGIGCIGADMNNFTSDRKLSTPALFSIHRGITWLEPRCSLTQYGMYRRAVFSDIRFDDDGPFGGPGWGYEDWDFAFQMTLKGYENHSFYGSTYLHRAIHSSIPLLRADGLDPKELLSQRRKYIVDKWLDVLQIGDGPLREIIR